MQGQVSCQIVLPLEFSIILLGSKTLAAYYKTFKVSLPLLVVMTRLKAIKSMIMPTWPSRMEFAARNELFDSSSGIAEVLNPTLHLQTAYATLESKLTLFLFQSES